MTTQSQVGSLRFKRIGGELPAGCDRLTTTFHWQTNWLGFSHGRAALGWFLDRNSIRSAAICAYICPSVPEFFRKRGISLALYDIGARIGDIAALSQGLEKPSVVLIPALFGSPPWTDASELSAALDKGDRVLIDAAQTAFGHMDFAAPPQGAVLSCPRKTTSLPDGAVLALPSGDWMATTQDLPLAQDAKALKEAARALWATGILDHEELALRCHQESEEAWPDAPHRISDESKLLLSHLDRDWHKRIRLSNRISLAGALDPALALWPADGTIPFSLPIFVENQQELLSRLQDERIFATALWPDAERDPEKHPLADWVASHLVSLPIDQRHEEADMLRVAKAVNRWASPAYQAERPPSMMMF